MARTDDPNGSDDGSDEHEFFDDSVARGKELAKRYGIDFEAATDELDQLFRRVVCDVFLQPVLEVVKKSGVKNAAEHARRTGVHRGTTAKWWRRLRGDSRAPGGPEERPSLETFLLTIAGFGIVVGEVLPTGAEASAAAWAECIHYLETHWLGAAGGRLASPEEVACLHLILQSDQWQRALETNSSRDLEEAGEWILEMLRERSKEGEIRSLADIKGVSSRWLVAGMIASALLDAKWRMELDEQ